MLSSFTTYRIAGLIAFIVVALAACKPDDPIVGPSDKGDLEDIPYDPRPYTIVKPAHFPEMPIPADNPMTEAGVQLGRRLFYDKILARDSTMSCASCHLPSGSFTDNKALSIGIDGLPGRRSSMSLLNIGYVGTGLFWDGRSPNLEKQALLPVEDPVELHHTWPEVVEKLKAHRDYPRWFREAFGIKDRQEITKELAGKAMAQFQRILVSSGESKFDRWRYGGESGLFDDEEIDGFLMFFFDSSTVAGVNVPDAQCFHCHGGIMLTSNQYFSNGLDAVTGWDGYTDRGRGEVTGNEKDNGKFRTPTLRNIALSAPYMHDGRFQTLEEVLDFYGNHGNSAPPYEDPLIDQIGFRVPGSPNLHQPLNNQQKQSIIKFLHTLTDTQFVNNPDIQDPFQ